MSILRALIIDDSPDDADLLHRQLARDGYEVVSERVDTGADLEVALRDQEWSIVFSDWSMPRFSAPEALNIVKRHDIDIPFIIVSGTIDEEFVIEAMKNGANDFFVKDRLALLATAVERQLGEAAGRRERVQMQETLMISDRMASVGILAAGVAHEINNPLAVVVGNLELVLHELAELEIGDQVESELQEILAEVREAHEAAQRIRNVANDLKLFARSDNEVRDAVDIQRVLESSLRMARNEIRHRAIVHTDFAPVPLVAGNESRLGQVFLNLIVNAAQSITEGHVEENEVSITTALGPDGRAVVTVRDTGSGMSADVRKHLFSPFFTTKPIGVGTGLGLSICHRIVSEMGGTIAAESEIGRGSAFTVRLETTTETVSEVSAQKAVGVASTHRSPILVIDDEPSIGVLVKKVLKAHDVTETISAGEALEWILQGKRFDTIFCDLMMPDVTGMDFHTRLMQIAPDQAHRVIFLTGGTFTSQARDFLENIDNIRLDKPFDIDELRLIANTRQ